VLSVYQDFHARIFSKNVTAILAFEAQKQLEQSNAGEYNYKINFTQALSTMRDSIVLLFQGTGPVVKTILIDLIRTMFQAIEPIRPGRKFPRNHKRSQRRCYPNYKPVL
jgi:hypothetical protein